MATYGKINKFIENLANAMDLNADTLGIALSNTAPGSESVNPQGDTGGILGNVTQIAYTNYADSLTVDRRLEGVTSQVTAGVYKLDADDFTISATGGALSPFRYLYVFDDTVASPADPLIAVWDHGAAISLANGDSAAISFGANGLLTIT
jgi:hypothetical protein